MAYEDWSDKLPEELSFSFMQVHAGPHENFTYVIGPPDGGQAVAIDPAFELTRLFRDAEQRDLEITHALFTHAHWDHIGGIPDIIQRGVQHIAIHQAARDHPKIREAQQHDAHITTLQDGDTLNWAGEEAPIQAIHTPGHQPESTCYLIGKDDEPRILATGDCLFVNTCGRTDFPGGDTDKMFQSMEKIRNLPNPEGIFLMPGHHYADAPWKTLAQQLVANPALATGERVVFGELPFLKG